MSCSMQGQPGLAQRREDVLTVWIATGMDSSPAASGVRWSS